VEETSATDGYIHHFFSISGNCCVQKN